VLWQHRGKASKSLQVPTKAEFEDFSWTSAPASRGASAPASWQKNMMEAMGTNPPPMQGALECSSMADASNRVIYQVLSYRSIFLFHLRGFLLTITVN